MKRIKTFLKYALVVILFYFLSNMISDILIETSYKDVGEGNIQIEESDNGFEIAVEKANSNKQQAYFVGTVKNNSDKVIEKQYVKVESYYKGQLMQTKYLAFENLQPGEERKFKLLYSVGNIDEFRVSYVDEIPTNETVVDQAIDKIQELWNKGMSAISNISTEGIEGVANSVSSAFVPVHVEGEDWQLFIAVMWVLWAAF